MRFLIFVFFAVFTFVFISIHLSSSIGSSVVKDISYSEALTLIQTDRVTSVIITEKVLELTPNRSVELNKDIKSNLIWKTVIAGTPEILEGSLLEHGVAYGARESRWFSKYWITFLWVGIILLLFLPRFFNKQKSTFSSLMNFTNHKGRQAQNVTTTFADVAGHDNVREQLQEGIAFLKDPKRFSRLGAKIPKGVLLYGPPGTGKTLMARATAGEAGVPFIHISGSDFVEMFVGVGAVRVQSLFAEARRKAPCIIFIDEIDAVGSKRSNVMSSGDSERDQTINKLLAEMDGFEQTTGIIIIAATNRPDNLDEALKRRFERKVFVGLPSLMAREQILRVHAKGKVTNGIDYTQIARLTPGMSGAALENVLNEAALIATREEANAIKTDHLVRAVEIVAVGHKDTARRLSENDRQTVAVHEAGHATVSAALGRSKQVARVSIIPTSHGALGYNLNAPQDETDTLLRSSDELLDDVVCLLGGRAAEQTMSGKISTGASDDLRRANTILYHYIVQYGFSEVLSNRVLTQETDWSETTAQTVDEEVIRLLKTCYARSLSVIVNNRSLVGALVGDLLTHEELSGENLLVFLSQVENPPEIEKEVVL
ncbi:MAG: ATP-dependent zinc metalloprotease FtsH [Candidatus Uhrbacteria bacterium GW2011_GWF2_39_13]|uniref:ATP-dependent zinc metalloprotease FtsH n=1 Tax=Candidatus Uhrbacteria bacterium GW2011_GWF2_39_13 TaxID=1618995 RepID=A0A0G0MM21_9BACT|nr:MAG: ATP-dependent zinc metalloprotease FtsH [Candidatus Uhrbacteria bacterium GW2011_GWF2_39_13]HAU66369.1 cell division protein FtsH [Candidatus Uhrbacteria bacterium]